MKQQERDQRESPIESPSTVGGQDAETSSLVHVLTDFLQGASKYVLEEDCETYCA